MSIVLDGTSGITAPNATVSGTVQGSPVRGGLVSGTAVASTSGTSIDFTGIPSWVKRITVMFSGVSTSGTSNIQIQLGTGGTPTTSGYLSGAGTGASTNIFTGANSTTGLILTGGTAAICVYHGAVNILNISSNSWCSSGALGRSDALSGVSNGGSVALSGVLDRVRITTVNGTDTFDAGTINIIYEG